MCLRINTVRRLRSQRLARWGAAWYKISGGLVIVVVAVDGVSHRSRPHAVAAALLGRNDRAEENTGPRRLALAGLRFARVWLRG
jgi:hypothetical protein